ncbi:hypothetical protein C7M61_002957 [Candidozyma pseudohaemuli]|uniref:Photolyase/cryptochrome alpha/beta domain-containing protein n=1 Tax=Candidozyma pseudohaemuli TaxID=418784 RepID=A0A2P7YR46_9ASCO|nr:hypothetical protein C7M61_002957 [[Candida] pseudohaemulonii]PSK38394.1 hypothetical protein C7M61_002957 [[Candida] pseudohaemulonii]
MSKKQKLEQLPKFSSKFYPKELPTHVAATKYAKEENKPYNILLNKVDSTEKERSKVKPANAIAHWFVRDFRTFDNHGLSRAYKLAAKHNLPLVCFWVNCKELTQAHGKSKFQMHYRVKSMEKLHKKLADLNIAFVTVDVETRSKIVPSILDFLLKHKVSHLFVNQEYEIDELRLSIKLVDAALEKCINFEPVHDTCTVQPGEIVTKSKGTQFAVFTPWYRAWVEYVNNHLIDQNKIIFDEPQKLENSVDELIKAGHGLPEIKVDQKRFNKYWKEVGEDDAFKALERWVKLDTIKNYGDTRNNLDGGASNLSVHISSGTISPRTILWLLHENELLTEANETAAPGITEFLRQISWREFYKNILCFWPHVGMFKPFHLEYSDLPWEYNKDHFLKWQEGQTGYPIVDASMRNLKETGHLNNRGRLIVASFLTKHLLTDWRYGEEYFMSQLIDGDFASNNGGWGFAASTGVDPQPYFRVFKPSSQSERFDPKGDFIKKWVPELKDVDSKNIHSPWDNPLLKEIAKKNGYPEPIVDYKFGRQRALDVFKETMQKGKKELEGDDEEEEEEEDEEEEDGEEEEENDEDGDYKE